jgi:hypothetical protein
MTIMIVSLLLLALVLFDLLIRAAELEIGDGSD